MSKANIPTTPIRSRRAVLAGIASAAALPIAAAIPTAALTAAPVVDPIHAAIDDATRGMSGLEPWSPSTAADAQLIALGRQYEPLLEEYFAAHQDWSHRRAQVTEEHEAQFGSPKQRRHGRDDTPEIKAAFEERYARFGVDDANDRMDAIHLQMEPIEFAIRSLQARSIEGLRAKVLVALYEIRPSFAGQVECEFDNEVAFQQLLIAVAQLVGFTEKVESLGLEMPDLPEFEDGDDLIQKGLATIRA